MTLLEEIYCDAISALAMDGNGNRRSICANELRSIRNRLEPMMPDSIRKQAAARAAGLANQK